MVVLVVTVAVRSEQQKKKILQGNRLGGKKYVQSKVFTEFDEFKDRIEAESWVNV